MIYKLSPETQIRDFIDSMDSSSIIRIKRSKDRTNKHTKRGRKGKDCKYFDNIQLVCGLNGRLCNSKYCKKYNKIKNTDNCIDDLHIGDETYIEIPRISGTHEKTNEYIPISKKIGTPCHIGYIKSDGIRRHKTKCIYYIKEGKFCKYYGFKCIGSSKCVQYMEELSK